jgi:cell division cycle protein 20 (cofactor of APC complex)
VASTLKFVEAGLAPSSFRSQAPHGVLSQTPNVAYRALPLQPERILDAPDILDDYYLNLLAWGDSNLLGVALKTKLYLWNSASCSVSQLIDSEDSQDLITSVAWMAGGHCLAVGDSRHQIKLYDVETGKTMRSITAHSDRVSSLAWNGNVLSSGSRDSFIVNCDTRIENYFVRYSGHLQEVCGLKWSPDGTQLASGGNDNQLCIWDLSSTTPRTVIRDHTAAVKGLAWCPWKDQLLASGGGSADRCIKLWNSSTGQCVKSIDTGSQVCALEWNQHDRELLSAHGYAHNQLSLWSSELNHISDFTGHTARVLYLAQNPEGSTVVSAGADETLRFWKIFESSAVKAKKAKQEARADFAFRYR